MPPILAVSGISSAAGWQICCERFRQCRAAKESHMQFDFAYPYFQVQMTQDGSVFDPNEVNALMAAVTAQTGAPSDLIVMSHGWNNNMDDAKDLYAGLSKFFKPQIDANPKLNGRKY